MAEYICPNCKNPIYDDEALSCIYCGQSLKRDIGLMGKIKYSRFNLIITVVTIIIICSFIIILINKKF